jgi:hypothetical protein
VDNLDFVIPHNFITNILQSCSFLRIKQPEREVELSSPSRAEVKNECNYTPYFPYRVIKRLFAKCRTGTCPAVIYMNMSIIVIILQTAAVILYTGCNCLMPTILYFND